MPRKTNYTKITSDDKLAMLNLKNIQLKNDFLLYLRSIRRSEGTITGYDSDLNIVFTYMYDELGDKDFKDLTKRDIISIQPLSVRCRTISRTYSRTTSPSIKAIAR